MKTKRMTRILVMVLVLAMVLSVSAFAAWPVYGGNDDHNAVVSSAPTSTSPIVTKIDLLNPETGWDGVDNVPVMRTVGTGSDAVTYAYVFYDGHSDGAHLAKVNCSATAPYIVWDKQISNTSGFQLSTPVLVSGATEADDVIYLAGANAGQVLSDSTLDTIAQSGSAWSLTGGTAAAGQVTVASGATATLTQRGFNMVSSPAKRVAIGVFLGNTTTDTAIGTTAQISYNLNGTSATIDYATSNEIVEEVKNASGQVVSYNHYFYLNENIGAVAAADTNQITFTVKMIGGEGTIEYGEVFQHTGSLVKVTNLDKTDDKDVTAQSLTASIAISQQINTPVTKYGNYVYFGTWSGGSRAGAYYQVNLSTGAIATYTPADYGFYWAGAVVVGDYIYFASDGGYLHWGRVDNFSGITRIALPSIDGNAPGDARSTIMTKDGNLYFTSKGSSYGNFYCYTIGSDGTPAYSWGAKLGGNCTSTPVIADSGKIYVGFYSGFSAGGLQKVAAPSTTGTDAIGTAATITYNSGTTFNQPVQCTPVVYSGEDEDFNPVDYFYFNTNSSSGAGYCFSISAEDTDATLVWSTAEDTYALGGMAIENGIAVFGNDYNHLYVVK